jgi:hypothetical protein
MNQVPRSDASQSTEASSPPGEKSAGKSFGQVASRVSAWTSKLLLSGIVLVAGLAFGVQVLSWWRESPQPSNAASSVATLPTIEGPLNDLAAGHSIQFGNQPWQITRRSLAGSQEDATKQLTECAAELLASTQLPANPPSPAERQFLELAAHERPARVLPDGSRLFALDSRGVLPMVVGVRDPAASSLDSAQPAKPAFSGAAAASAKPTGTVPSQPTIASPYGRVVTWGMAVPRSEQAWTMYVFVCRGKAADALQLSIDMRLPPRAERVMATVASDGSAMVSFNGPANAATAWKDFWDHWADERSWQAQFAWRESGRRWNRSWTVAGPKDANVVDIHFGPDQHGGTAGLLILSPAVEPK